jgi:hypothetical protein
LAHHHPQRLPNGAVGCRHLGIVDDAVTRRNAFIGLADLSGKLAMVEIALAVGQNRTREGK